jgi:hypothetical protein
LFTPGYAIYGGDFVSERRLPWNRDEIFHDDLANYPVCDYLFLSSEEAKEENTVEKTETGRF